MSERERVPEVIGRRVRAMREETGRSQDDLADAARRAGLDWTRASVASLETGRRGLSAEELILLPLALHYLDGRSHTIAELLEGGPNQVGLPTAAHGTAFLRRLLSGGDAAEANAFERQMSETGWGDQSDKDFVTYMAAREAERHVARALGLRAETVAVKALRRWNRGLTEEREARVQERAAKDASSRSVQAVRGHVTRELIQELRDERKRHGK